jgi:tryptophanyl-tRNA synthetase
MSSFTGKGEAERMTQFKDKSKRNPDNVNVGLFSYPILMACDILLYQADAVPVGDDQKQHLELTRNLAQRFNHYYSDTFTIPEPYIPEVGARVMSLQDPKVKMSKSDPNHSAVIFLTDDNDTIVRKIKRSVTDSGSEIRPGKGKEGIENLITLLSVATGKNANDIVTEYAGEGYGKFKSDVAEAVAAFIEPIREEFKRYRADKELLTSILTKGDEQANKVATKTLYKVYKKVGFLQY